MNTRSLVGLAVSLAALAAAAPASALDVLSQPVTAATAADQSCTTGKRGGTSVAQKSFTMPTAGWVTARLDAAGGDWDDAIIDIADGRVVAGSASAGAGEVASGLAVQGSRLVVQACRLTGSASTARLGVGVSAVDTSQRQKAQLVRVSTTERPRSGSSSRRRATGT